MKPVIRFNKKTPRVFQSFFRDFEDTPVIISVIGGNGSGKTRFIESIFGLQWIHGRRRHRYDVFAARSTGSDTDLLVLEWQLALELHPNSLKEDARVLKFAISISDIVIVMPYAGVSYIDYASFFCQFIEPSDALFVFSPCSDIEAINERAKVALSKRRVYTLPMTDSPDFTKKVEVIKEAIYNEITQHSKQPLQDYHRMLDHLPFTLEEYDDSYDIDSFLEQQCYMTLKQITRAMFANFIKSKLPMEEAELSSKIEECLGGLNAIGRKIVLRPTTTFSTDIKTELKHIFKEWKKENYNLSHEQCEKAYLEFKKQKALDAEASADSVKLVGPAKREFESKIVDVEALPMILPLKRKLSQSQGEGKGVKKQRVIAASPLKKTVLYNGAALQDVPSDIQKRNKALKALQFFNDKFFRAALDESPLYRITKDCFKIVVKMSQNKSKMEFVDAYRIDQESGEKIPVDQATRNKIDIALKDANRRNKMPSAAVHTVVKAVFGGSAKQGNCYSVLNPMGIEEDLTFHFPLMEVLVNNELKKFNKFTVKAKTRLSIVKLIIVFLKVLIKAEKEKLQELFDALRVSCNFGNADMKNEHFEMFFDDVDHTVVDLSDDPTAEEVSMYNSHEQPMDVSEDRVMEKVMDVVDDESLFTYDHSVEEEEISQIPSSRYSLADVIDLSDDE